MRWPWSKKEETATCQCGHERCYHEHGKGRCHVDMTDEASDEDKARNPHGYWICACQAYIPDRGGDDDNGKPGTPVDPEVEELNKMYAIKER
jgi:hypothetical protein